METSASFTLAFSHSQIAVFQCGIDKPFNDWAPSHNDQGFAWRNGSVSFGTLEDGGEIEIDVSRKASWIIDNNSIRIIRVPFSVRENGVEIASIVMGQEVPIPAGLYSLFFETGMLNKLIWCKLTFVPDSDPQPEILKADADLKPPRTFNMTAQPA